MKKARSVPVLAWWKGMSVKDIEDAEKVGVELRNIHNFWRGNTLEHMRAMFGPIDEKTYIQIPGGVLELYTEACLNHIQKILEKDNEE